MRPLFAIASLTIKASLRFRLFYVVAVLLLLTVAVLPAIIKHDGTAHGLAQITLTYTLGFTTVLLGFVTLWLGCGTLAREIEERQIQLVDVKPVARWQVWLGKWLGILGLNAGLLFLAGGTIYGLLLWRADQLPTQPRDERAALFSEVLVARASAVETPVNLEAAVEARLAEARQRGLPENVNEAQLRQLLRNDIQAGHEVVGNDHMRRWVVDLSSVQAKVGNQPLHLRTRFFGAQMTATTTYRLVWQAGPLDQPRRTLEVASMAADTVHELVVPPGLLDAQGRLTIDCQNRSGASVVFPLDGGLTVLYRETSFTVNLVRALLVILCWLGVLAALGMAAASGLSFPVAAFVSLSVLLVALSTNTLAQTIQQGGITEANHETGVATRSWFDAAAVAVFKGILAVVDVAGGFSPVEALSTGRSVTWGELARAVAQVTVFLTSLIGATGAWIFTRRELAGLNNG